MLKQTLFILLLVFSFSLASALDFAGGDGTSGNPYQISNWTALNQTRLNLTASYSLVSNLSSSDADYINPFVTIGTNVLGTRFTGTFNGNGNTISDLIISQTTDYAGLFAYVTGNISNLGIINANITCASYCGTFAGQLTAIGNLERSYSSGNVTTVGTSKTYTGGLVGYYASPLLNNSYSTAKVSGYQYVGGLAGRFLSNTGTIINCYSTGKITATNTWSGGLTGYTVGSIKDSYYNGNLTGYRYVGGLAGLKDTATTIINNSYSTGYLFANLYGGGLVGQNVNGNINYSYSTITITNGSQVGGLVGLQTLGTIQNSYYIGDITGGNNIGGITGKMASSTNILDSYSVGNISGIGYVGGLVGDTVATINRCNSSMKVTASSNINGGLVGAMVGGLVNNSYAIGNVTGVSTNGGLIGDVSSNGQIFNSYALGNVATSSAFGNYNGGLLGSLTLGQVFTSYAKGKVNSGFNAGGFLGQMLGGNIYNSYATGNATGTSIQCGSFAGAFYAGTIDNSFGTGKVNCTAMGGFSGYNGVVGTTNNSYWDMNTTGLNYSYENAIGYTTLQMKNISSFSNWTIAYTNQSLNDGYPFLGFEVGNTTTWLIWDGINSQCWTKIGNSIFITKPCFIPFGFI